MATSPTAATTETGAAPVETAPKATPTPEARTLPGTTVDTTKLKDLNRLKDIQDALKESAKTMLQIKDGSRLLLVAQAAQCAETPMGLEFQYNVLDMLRHLSIQGNVLSQLRHLPEIGALEVLKHKLGKLNYPEQLPTEAIGQFITDHTKDFPPDAVPARLALRFNAGKLSPLGLAKELQGKDEFAALKTPFLQSLMGLNAENANDISAMLTNVGIDVVKNRKAISAALRTGSQHGGFDKTLAIGVFFLIATAGIQMLQQDAPQQQRTHAG